MHDQKQELLEKMPPASDSPQVELLRDGAAIVRLENNTQMQIAVQRPRNAESLANRWTNSAYGCDVVGEDADSVTLAAVFMDYENNTRHVMQKKVSRYYKNRQGAKVM